MNQRTILRRNWRGDEADRKEALNHLSASRRTAEHADTIPALLGVEGDAAAVYFRAFAGLLAPPEAGASAGTDVGAGRGRGGGGGGGQHGGRSGGRYDDRHDDRYDGWYDGWYDGPRTTTGTTTEAAGMGLFRFDARNRRPPTDPVNAMLSLAYAMLTRHLTVALATVGLDPYRGLFHAPRYGKPALALDIMEPFRPIIADSVVLSAVNTGEVSASDFVSAPTGTALNATGRRRFVGAFERRLSQETTHPLFGYRLSMRRLLLLQARLLCRHLLGELPQYPHYLPQMRRLRHERRTDLHRDLRHLQPPAVAPRLPDHARLRGMATALGLPVPAVEAPAGRARDGAPGGHQDGRGSRSGDRHRPGGQDRSGRHEPWQDVLHDRTPSGRHIDLNGRSGRRYGTCVEILRQRPSLSAGSDRAARQCKTTGARSKLHTMLIHRKFVRLEGVWNTSFQVSSGEEAMGARKQARFVMGISKLYGDRIRGARAPASLKATYSGARLNSATSIRGARAPASLKGIPLVW